MRNRRQPSGEFFRRLKANSKPKPNPVSRIRKLKESDIWQWAGIVEFIAVVAGLVAVLLTVWHIRIDLDDRHTQRIAQAWGLVTQVSPGNSGKGPALEYLNNQGISLTGINLSMEDNGSAVYLIKVVLPEADLDSANLSGADLQRADLSRAHLWSANLSGALLAEADLLGANMLEANLSGAVLYKADLSGARLAQANLSGARLEEANLSGAVLYKADLSGARLAQANLSGANLYDANLSGANISEAKNLSQDQLDTACGDDETRLPDGLTIETCRSLTLMK